MIGKRKAKLEELNNEKVTLQSAIEPLEKHIKHIKVNI